MRAFSAFDNRSSLGTLSLVEALSRVALARPRPRITIMRAGALGDTLLLLPTLEMLRTSLPRVQLTLVGSAWAEAIRPLLPFPLEVVPVDAPALTPLFGPPPAQDRTGIFATADAAVLYTKSDELVRNAMKNCRGPVLVRDPAPPGGVHAAAHLAGAFVRGPLAVGDLPYPELQPTADLREWARAWLAQRLNHGERPVALHPGSGGRRKQWPAAGFAWLAKELGAPIVLLEGPADAEACRQVAAEMPSTLPVARAAGLRVAQVAALLQACRLYVGNDSGMSHLAAALGVPTIVVVGPTDPAVWAPLGPCVVVVGPTAGAAWPTPAAILEALQRLPASVH